MVELSPSRVVIRQEERRLWSASRISQEDSWREERRGEERIEEERGRRGEERIEEERRRRGEERREEERGRRVEEKGEKGKERERKEKKLHVLSY